VIEIAIKSTINNQIAVFLVGRQRRPCRIRFRHRSAWLAPPYFPTLSPQPDHVQARASL